MTESEAKAMLEAYMECDRRKNEVAYEKQCHEECDNCKLCYAQGTVGDHKEALQMAIKVLEKQIPKEVVCYRYYRYGYYLCPTCEHYICDKETAFSLDDTDFSYCDGCGQKLKWSDKE